MVRSISAAETRPLRAQILRLGQAAESLVYPGDDHPEVLHAGAFHDGKLVGVATIYPEDPPTEYAARLINRGSFRLRGMATTPEVRGLGYGRQLLELCFEHIRNHSSDLLWCNARIGALDFYKRLGLETIGPEFEIVGIGGHYVMWVVLVNLLN